MSMGGYPAGAEYDREAPWNRNDDIEDDREPIEVGLTAYITVKVSLTAKTDDYETDRWGYLERVNNLDDLVKANVQMPDGWDLESVDDVTLEECYTRYRHSDWFKD